MLVYIIVRLCCSRDSDEYRVRHGLKWRQAVKRLCIGIVLILALTPVFAEGNREKEADEGLTKLTFWITHGPPDSIALTAMVDEYNNSQGNAEVEIVKVPGAETDMAKLMTAVRGGTGPDIYMLDRFTVAQRAAAGVLEDLTEVMQAADPMLPEAYLPYAWRETQFQGRTYALPFDTDARVLYYNRAMIAEAGADPEILDPANGPITVLQAREIARAVDRRDADGAYSHIGFIPYFEQGWHYTWGFNFEGRFADLEAGRVTPGDPGVIAAYEFAKGWAADMGPQKVQTFLSTFVPPDNPTEQHPFLIGRVAMMISGDWVLSWLDRYAPDLDFGVTYIPVPRAGADPSTWAGGWALVVPTGSDYVEEAFDFMRWYAGEPGQRIYTLETSHLPTYKSLMDDDSLFEGDHEFFRSSLAFASSRPALPVGALYWDALTRAWNAVTLRQEDPGTVLREVFDEVQPELNRFLPLQ